MKIRAVIVEDEEASRLTLKNYIDKYCDGVEVIGESGNVEEGVSCIKDHQPDLVFLDVEMPFGNAFDLLEKFEEVFFETIFVTAYSHYAIKAINYSASHYLLKPIDDDDLAKAAPGDSDVMKRVRFIGQNQVPGLRKTAQQRREKANKPI